MDQPLTDTDMLAQLSRQTIDLLTEGRQITGLSSGRFDEWIETCGSIEAQVAEDLIRVAVVGSIKSGKSTFTNAVLGGDYLKRGAGVVTSMVTRVHRGDVPSAKLFLKSWDEINADISQAMVLLPESELPAGESFDLRKQSHREHLQRALVQLRSQLWTADGTRNINDMLLSSYLEGFGEVASRIGDEAAILEFGADDIARHRDFSGHDRCAVYLQDILLHINSERVRPHVELADCQGSDSPNPLHLAMIQEYLRLTHLIIYVVSSRTGLRRADMRFLAMIKKIGLMPNVLFVINCDFSEHESLEGLQKLIDHTRRELALLNSEPEIYSVSALFTLLQTQGVIPSPKEQNRLAQWEREEDFAAFSDAEWNRFQQAFAAKVTRERHVLFTQSHLMRIKVILNGLTHWMEVNGDLLTRDIDTVQNVSGEIQNHRSRIEGLQNLLKSTLDGEAAKVKKELQQEVARFFDDRNGQVFDSLLTYVRQYQPTYDKYQEQLSGSGFSQTLYSLFQDFRRAVDLYLTETVNPEILSFVRHQETRIQDHFQQAVEPYDSLAADAVSTYTKTIGEMGLATMDLDAGAGGVRLNSLEKIKRLSDLAPPPAQNTMRYSAKIRSDAVFRLGFYSAVKLLRRLLKRDSPQGGGQVRALKDGVRGIKRETEKSLRAHFIDYRENLKFQFLNKLVDAVSNHHYETMRQRLELYDTDLSDVAKLLRGRDSDRKDVIANLEKMRRQRNDLATAVAAAEGQLTRSDTTL